LAPDSVIQRPERERQADFVATSLEDASILTIKQDFPQVTAALSLGRDLVEVPRAKWASVRYSELFPLRRIRACRADW
jgi:glycerophosphoryl diester phosphodiesterase